MYFVGSLGTSEIVERSGSFDSKIGVFRQQDRGLSTARSGSFDSKIGQPLISAWGRWFHCASKNAGGCAVVGEVGAGAVGGVGFWVDLQAGGFVFVEGAV